MDNKFSLYRKIRYDRTYRPLGKMSLWRVVIGSLLLLSILFFTGIMSRPFAAKGDFRTAKALLITPAWLERYHPDDMAFLNAGILYQDGDYEAALEGFSAVDTDAARAMRSRAALRLAEDELAQGDEAAAAAAFAEIDEALLPEEDAALFTELASALGG